MRFIKRLFNLAFIYFFYLIYCDFVKISFYESIIFDIINEADFDLLMEINYELRKILQEYSLVQDKPISFFLSANGEKSPRVDVLRFFTYELFLKVIKNPLLRRQGCKKIFFYIKIIDL